VTNGLSQEEFEEALAVVRSYLEVQRGADSVAGSLAGSETKKTSRATRETSRASAAPQAVAPTELSVDGGVEAVSFTGDGSTLTSLDPANLSPGTAAIDVTGTAANVTGTGPESSPPRTETSPKLAHRVDQKRGELPGRFPNIMGGTYTWGGSSGCIER
jgi:hypothetical protein